MPVAVVSLAWLDVPVWVVATPWVAIWVVSLAWAIALVAAGWVVRRA